MPNLWSVGFEREIGRDRDLRSLAIPTKTSSHGEQMSQNPTQKGPEIPVIKPICPGCREPLEGLNVAGMKLPIPGPDGKPVAYMNFMVPCCPNPECGIALGVQFTGEEAAPSSAAAAGLWTPPGSH